jgi:hypothetical protein
LKRNHFKNQSFTEFPPKIGPNGWLHNYYWWLQMVYVSKQPENFGLLCID